MVDDLAFPSIPLTLFSFFLLVQIIVYHHLDIRLCIFQDNKRILQELKFDQVIFKKGAILPAQKTVLPT